MKRCQSDVLEPEEHRFNCNTGDSSGASGEDQESEHKTDERQSTGRVKRSLEYFSRQ